MKICCICGHKLKNNSFKKDHRNNDSLQSQCINCQKKYRRKHYLANRQKYINKACKWKKEFTLWWKNYKTNFKCEKCGESDPICIDFHHKNSSTKVKAISTLAGDACRIKLMKELKKCTPLCANCHRKEHYKNKNKRKKIMDILRRAITIPKHAELKIAPSKTIRTGCHYEILIGIGNDHVAFFTIDDEALDALRDEEDLHFK